MTNGSLKDALETGGEVRIVAKRPCKCAEQEFAGGDLVGMIRVEPQVTVNWMVDAIRSGLAGVEKETPLYSGRHS